MRRALLIVLTFAILLSAVPVSAENPGSWSLSTDNWWTYLLPFWLEDRGENTTAADDALPHLDPNGSKVVDLSEGIEESDSSTSIKVDLTGDALPHLDPNG